MTEADPPAPVSSYGRSKLEGERVVRQADVPWVIVRPPAVYGPRDRDVLTFFRVVARGVCPRLGASERSVSLIYVKDLAQGVIRAAAAEPGETFFLSDPEPYAWERVVSEIAGALGKKVRSIPVPRPALVAAACLSEWISRVRGRAAIFNRDKVRELRHAHWTCSAAKARRELGFVPAHGLQRGVAETAAWYRAEGWL